ncbi:MAG: hypothetical protein AAGA21_08760 [Pseudomonadota bacterium]
MMIKKFGAAAVALLSLGACATGDVEIPPVAQVTQKPVTTIEEGKVLGLELTSSVASSPLLEKAEKQLGRQLVTMLGKGNFTKVVKIDQPHDYKLAAVIADFETINPRLSALGELVSDTAGIEAGQVVSELAVKVDLQDAAGGGGSITKFNVKGGIPGVVSDTATKNLAIQQTALNVSIALTCINEGNSSESNVAAMCAGF